MPKVTLISNSVEETMLCATRLGEQLSKGDVVLLEGDLGAGKTTFVKGLVKAFRLSPNKVNSPTFVLMNYYKGKLPLYHFDLYRLEKPSDFLGVNLDEYIYGEGITLIEWAERLGSNIPPKHYLVRLEHNNEHSRKICISYP